MTSVFKKSFYLVFILVFGIISNGICQPRFIPENFSELAKYAEESVVNIRTFKKGKTIVNPYGQSQDPFEEFLRRFYGGDIPRKERDQRSLGSGFIVDEDGFIVTNNHVVKDSDSITVKLKNGEEYDAKVVGTDPNTDLAIIKIKAGKKLPFLKFGDSKGLKVGEWVVAIGSPFGLEQTVTAGIVSAKGRVIDDGHFKGLFSDFIQTDASINPGNSGGPLLNLDGEVVGINTAILANAQGIGFAIPSDMAKNIIGQLKDNGEVTRGWLGVSFQAVDEGLAEYNDMEKPEGVYITSVLENSPAEKSGLKVGDIIISVDNEKIKADRDLVRIIANKKVGARAKITIIRSGKKKVVIAKISKRDDKNLANNRSLSDDTPVFGLTIGSIDREIAMKLRIPSGEGVLVTGVAPGSKADKAGFGKGDVIFQINHKPVNSVEDFNKIMTRIKKGEEVSFLVKLLNMRSFGVVKIRR